MSSQFDINGQEYEESLINECLAEFTPVELDCYETVERAVWDKIEEEMSGYIAMLTDKIAARLWLMKILTDKEIKEIIHG